MARPDCSACSRATGMLRAAASTPMTSAPSRAIGSASSPPPQPMSRSRSPAKGRGALGVAAELRRDLVDDVVEPARVEHVQRLELAVRDPTIPRPSPRTWRSRRRQSYWRSAVALMSANLHCSQRPVGIYSAGHEGKPEPRRHGPRSGLYPPIEPFRQQVMEMPGGHRVYVEQCGRPDGVPVVVLHGGPGGGCSPGMRRFFDPAHYRVVLFDQRGCGRSTPERQRREQHHLGPRRRHRAHPRRSSASSAGRCSAAPGAPASALIYAQTHPERVRGAGAARRLHHDPGRAPLVLRRRRRRVLAGAVGGLLADDPGGGAARPDRRLPPAAVRRRRGRADALRPRLGRLGERARGARPRRGARLPVLGLLARLRPAGEPLLHQRRLSRRRRPHPARTWPGSPGSPATSCRAATT